MTGLHSGHCTIRGNDGSYTPLLANDTTVAAVLREKYHTACEFDAVELHWIAIAEKGRK